MSSSSHELLIAKLHAYGFDKNALKLIHCYLSNRSQRTKVGDCFSSWKEILYGVPQGSILGPLLFNIFLCDLFFMIKDVDFASFADDTTPYVECETENIVLEKLTKASLDLFEWFDNNQMKANPEKCNFITNSNNTMTLDIKNQIIPSSNSVKLLGIHIDNKLTFNGHISLMCKKANQKLNALARISPYLDINKKQTLFNAFFFSQFSYCPLIWMCHSREMNNKINRIHEKSLRIIFNDKKSSFQELLDKDNSFTVHDKNIQKLCIEMFKVVEETSPRIFSELFHKRENKYDLRQKDFFTIPKINTVYNGSETISVLGPKIWNSLPNALKTKNSLSSFKASIKKWQPINCPSRLCKSYIAGVGFI